MDHGNPQSTIIVVPHSGTEELPEIAGNFRIDIKALTLDPTAIQTAVKAGGRVGSRKVQQADAANPERIRDQVRSTA